MYICVFVYCILISTRNFRASVVVLEGQIETLTNNMYQYFELFMCLSMQSKSGEKKKSQPCCFSSSEIYIKVRKKDQAFETSNYHEDMLRGMFPLQRQT